MPNYIVERHLPGFDKEKLAAAASLAKMATGKMTSEGTPVRYLRSFLFPARTSVIVCSRLCRRMWFSGRTMKRDFLTYRSPKVFTFRRMNLVSPGRPAGAASSTPSPEGLIWVHTLRLSQPGSTGLR